MCCLKLGGEELWGKVLTSPIETSRCRVVKMILFAMVAKTCNLPTPKSPCLEALDPVQPHPPTAVFSDRIRRGRQGPPVTDDTQVSRFALCGAEPPSYPLTGSHDRDGKGDRIPS